jgi:phosphoglycolate phosphatase-like HAD superfamily hydrolase
VRLVLFDIDGTLLSAGGSGRRAINAAFEEFFGWSVPADYWFDGKTDRQIVRELMRAEGHDDAAIDGHMDAVLARYLVYLGEALVDPAHPPRLYPGVAALLEGLEARDDVVVGLLTGNVRPGAHAKLSAVGLDPARFVIGAFGSDHERRPELPHVAQRRARETLGLDVAGPAMVVIGDTPDDIACSRGIGARAIAVATGRFTPTELEAHAPSAVFRDLSDTGQVMAAIMGDTRRDGADA